MRGKAMGRGIVISCCWECTPGQPLWNSAWRLLTERRTDLLYDHTTRLPGVSFQDSTGICSVHNHGMWESLHAFPQTTENETKAKRTVKFPGAWTELENIIWGRLTLPREDKYHISDLRCRLVDVTVKDAYLGKGRETRQRFPDCG